MTMFPPGPSSIQQLWPVRRDLHNHQEYMSVITSHYTRPENWWTVETSFLWSTQLLVGSWPPDQYKNFVDVHAKYSTLVFYGHLRLFKSYVLFLKPPWVDVYQSWAFLSKWYTVSLTILSRYMILCFTGMLHMCVKYVYY